MSNPTDPPAELFEHGRRLTLSQIVAMLLSRGGTEHSSVTLARNAKGVTQIEVVARTGGDGELQTLEEAEAEATEIYDRACKHYPLPTGYTRAT